MKKFSKRLGAASVPDWLGKLSVIALTFIFLIVVILNFFEGLGTSGCEEITRQDIDNMITEAMNKDIAGITTIDEPNYNFTINAKCVEKVYARDGKLFVKFKSIAEEGFGGANFVTQLDRVVDPGMYGVKITRNKVEITCKKYADNKLVGIC